MKMLIPLRDATRSDGKRKKKKGKLKITQRKKKNKVKKVGQQLGSSPNRADGMR